MFTDCRFCQIAGSACWFTDVLIVGRLDEDGLSFVPIALHKTDAASDYLPIKRQGIGMKGLPGVQFQN